MEREQKLTKRWISYNARLCRNDTDWNFMLVRQIGSRYPFTWLQLSKIRFLTNRQQRWTFWQRQSHYRSQRKQLTTLLLGRAALVFRTQFAPGTEGQTSGGKVQQKTKAKTVWDLRWWGGKILRIRQFGLRKNSGPQNFRRSRKRDRKFDPVPTERFGQSRDG